MGSVVLVPGGTQPWGLRVGLSVLLMEGTTEGCWAALGRPGPHCSRKDLKTGCAGTPSKALGQSPGHVLSVRVASGRADFAVLSDPEGASQAPHPLLLGLESGDPLREGATCRDLQVPQQRAAREGPRPHSPQGPGPTPRGSYLGPAHPCRRTNGVSWVPAAEPPQGWASNQSRGSGLRKTAGCITSSPGYSPNQAGPIPTGSLISTLLYRTELRIHSLTGLLCCRAAQKGHHLTCRCYLKFKIKKDHQGPETHVF